jgi:membrane protein DedA with SNARE-associated domain
VEYGDITTFVCRLLPAIRQLISIPAGLSKMPLGRFTFFTALGAGIWSAILAWIGWHLGALSENMTYAQLVYNGKDFLHKHFIWIALGLLAVIVVYAFIHHRIMKSSKKASVDVENS